MIKLFYMQYGFVALRLMFFFIKAGFIFPTTKEYQESVLWSFLSGHGSANRCLIAQIIISCPQLSFRSGVESSEIDPSVDAQIVRNRGHG